ncbi:MAG: PadR family transcriptional regulator [Candidatus Nanopelagicales bacterium]
MHAHTMRPPMLMMAGGHGRRRQPGFGPRGFGPGFGGPPRGRRDRGEVRFAILLLLDEQPRHGYEIITELTDRSEGRWRPSPGAVYPVLKRLTREGLVAPSETDGKKIFALTPAGKTLVDQQREEWGEPWARAADAGSDEVEGLWKEGRALGAAVMQISQSEDDEQIRATTQILAEARKKIYGMLAQ